MKSGRKQGLFALGFLLPLLLGLFFGHLANDLGCDTAAALSVGCAQGQYIRLIADVCYIFAIFTTPAALPFFFKYLQLSIQGN